MKKSPDWQVITVADQQPGWIVACVEGHSVGRVELLEPVALPAEVTDVFSILVILEDDVARIAV